MADFWFLVRKCGSLMDRGGEAIIREGLGVSLAEFMVLSVVDAHPGVFNQQSVADLLGLTKSTVSRQIERASSAGLLTAEAPVTSRREKMVTLTPAGTELVRRGDQLVQDFNRTIIPVIPAEDMATTLRILTIFAQSLGSGARLPSEHGVE
jgi:DNA-binding MarR family transcriptional regulator